SVTLIATFTDPYEAHDFLQNNQVDIIFLDIEMPNMNGLEFANEIDTKTTDIIFITAYDAYAIEAFRVHALGYLLKPIEKNILEKEINYIADKKNIDANLHKDIKLIVHAFGNPKIKTSDNKILEFRTKKAEELAYFLIQYGENGTNKDVIIDSLWKDRDYDKASNNLYTTFYYIKKELEKVSIKDVFYRRNGNYFINVNQIDCDYYRFVELSKDNNELSKKDLYELLQLYKGPYLGDKFFDWSDMVRIKLEEKYTQVSLRMVEHSKKENDLDHAKNILIQLIKNNMYCEKGYEELIKILANQNQRALIKKYYKEYINMTENDLEIKPSKEIVELVERYI
ncbi:MAG: response regulator, partial [Clostridia bacterium]|nr:response regulator [Clostridia bacterium]